MLTPEELRKRLCDPADADGARVCVALRDRLVFDASKEAKAEAWDELMLMMIQLALGPGGSLGKDVVKEVAISALILARQAVADELPRQTEKVFS